MSNPAVAVLIPAYNEEQTIADVVEIALQLTPEVWVISDGSSDDTVAQAEQAGAMVLDLQPNRGKGGAIFAGVLVAKAPYVILLDADLRGLTLNHLHALLDPVTSGQLDMTIGIFSGGGFMTDFGNRMTPHLSGQRASSRRFLLETPHLADQRWPEPAITEQLRRQRIRWSFIALPQLTQVMKEQKRGLWRGIEHRIRMYWELLRYHG